MAAIKIMAHAYILSIIWILATNCSVEAVRRMSLPSFVAGESKDYTMYQQDLPALSQFTMCFWFQAEPVVWGSQQFIVSLATPQSDNELIIGIEDNSSPRLLMRFGAQAFYIDHDNITGIFQDVHRHCISWLSGSSIKWYADINEPRKLELVASGSCGANSIREGGTLVLMQEQDSILGGFNVNQNMEGNIADFNMWDFEMDGTQLEALGCSDIGNLIWWDNLQAHNDPPMGVISVPVCEATEQVSRMKKHFRPRFADILVCRIEGAFLNVSSLVSTTENREIDCTKSCMRHEMCWSANYLRSTGECQLNSQLDLDSPSDFTTGLDADYVHLTARECHVINN